MADISKDELRKEITAILKDADLTSMSAKKVRQQLEEKLDCNLAGRKKEVDELVMNYVNSKDGSKKSKKKGKPAPESEEEEDASDAEEDGSEPEEASEEEVSDEEKKKPVKRGAPAKKPAATPPAKRGKRAASVSEESASEANNSDEVSEEEYSPKKPTPKPKGRKPGKKKKGSDSDSDADWSKAKKPAGKKGKGKGTGYTRDYTLSPELSELLGEDSMPRHEVVKRVWALIKERNLYDPKNKQYAICDDDLFKVIGVKRFRTFGMMKYLKTHFID